MKSEVILNYMEDQGVVGGYCQNNEVLVLNHVVIRKTPYSLELFAVI
jgi:hypothetical protein